VVLSGGEGGGGGGGGREGGRGYAPLSTSPSSVASGAPRFFSASPALAPQQQSQPR
jgi:hypothetical protein